MKHLSLSIAFFACVLLVCVSDRTHADPIDAGVFTLSNFRQCGGPSAENDQICFNGDFVLESQFDRDVGINGLAQTRVIGPNLGTQGASSVGFFGTDLTPAISMYAFTDGPYRFTTQAFGFQRYEFTEDGSTVSIGATLTYSQTGAAERSQRDSQPRGDIGAGIFVWQMLDDIFDPMECDDYAMNSGPGDRREGPTIESCILSGGFDDLVGLQSDFFFASRAPVVDGTRELGLTFSGNAGDVFFVGADMGVRAHLGGFADSRNTLLLDLDVDGNVVPTGFTEASFRRAPRLLVSEPPVLSLFLCGLLLLAVRRIGIDRRQPA